MAAAGLRGGSLVCNACVLVLQVAVAHSCSVQRYLDRWSHLTSWLRDEPPLDGDSVIIPPDQAILMDMSPPRLFLLLIQGLLVFDRQDLNLDASYILVHGGTLEVGTESEPFEHQATITLHGDRRKSVELPAVGAKVLAVMDKGVFADRTAGNAATHRRGTLDIHGLPRLRTWTRVAPSHLARGTTTIRTESPTDFSHGEVIVLTSPHEELLVDFRVDAHTFVVQEPLQHNHDCTHYSQVSEEDGEVVDNTEWCEVALLSRNVLIQGSGPPRLDGTPTLDPTSDASDVHGFGVHTGVFHGTSVFVRACPHGWWYFWVW